LKTVAKLFLLLGIVVLQSSCSTVQVGDYKDEKPVLVMEDYFNGILDAHGIYQDRTGLVKKRFHCVIKASWKDGVGTLDEDFTYSDGTTSKRIWTLKKRGDQYIGTASDVVGEAIGEISGNALRWKYVLSLEVDGKTYHVNFDDWMYLMDSKVMLNRSKMTKLGIDLGEVTLSFYKR
jgi:hypothetical protein